MRRPRAFHENLALKKEPPRRLHLQTVAIRRTQDSPLEQAVMVNGDKYAIDMDGDVIPAPVHWYGRLDQLVLTVRED